MGRGWEEWPAADRPVAKLLAHGPAALTEAELLAVVLAADGREAEALGRARRLVHTFGDLRELGGAGIGELCVAARLGRAEAARVAATFELARRHGECPFRTGEPFRGSADVYAHFRERLAAERREHFYAVLLDQKHRKIRDVAVSLGSLTASIVHPRDVFGCVVREAAAAVIFVHNHPSGDPTPSPEDLTLTRRLRDVGDLVGVRVLDHIVIGRGRYVSFVDEGYW